MQKSLPPLYIVLLGLQNAGKTTFLRTITGKRSIETRTTIGMDTEIVKYKGYTFQTIDMGGQKVFRESLWPHYTTMAQGVIFVFDIFDKDKLNEARRWFNEILQWVSEKCVIMFLANKIDLKKDNDDFVETDQIIRKFKLEQLASYPKRSFRIFEVSAKTSQNVQKSIEWMLDKLTVFVKEEIQISFIFIFNEENSRIYTNLEISEQIESLTPILMKKINEMKEFNIKENFLLVGDYKIYFNVESGYSYILGTKYDVSQDNLQRAIQSIIQIIKKEYYPPEEYKKQLEGIISLSLLRDLGSKST